MEQPLWYIQFDIQENLGPLSLIDTELSFIQLKCQYVGLNMVENIGQLPV